MPLSKLTDYCHSKYYRPAKCSSCQNNCKENCKACLHDMFYDHRERIYNCDNIIYCYTCRYIYKYSSEIIHVLKTIPLNFWPKIGHLKILSIGCGPCSELFAFDYFNTKNENIFNIDYTGYDINTIWKEINNYTKSLFSFPIKYCYHDVFIDYSDQTVGKEYPNIVILNYILSDINFHKKDTKTFLDELNQKIIINMNQHSLVFINDINNLAVRNTFIYLANLVNPNKYLKYYFNGYGSFGNQHNSTDVFYSIPFPIKRTFGSHNYCSSAQTLIVKG